MRIISTAVRRELEEAKAKNKDNPKTKNNLIINLFKLLKNGYN